MSRHRLSIQSSPRLDAMLSELSEAMGIPPAAVANVLLNQAALSQVNALRAATGQPHGGPTSPPHQPWPPTGGPREASHPVATSALASTGLPPGSHGAAPGQPSPSTPSPLGLVGSNQDQPEPEEGCGEEGREAERCPKCGAAVEERPIGGKTVVGCTMFDAQRAKEAGAPRCRWTRNVRDEAPSLARSTAQTRDSLAGAKAKKAAEDEAGAPSDLDDSDRMARLLAAVRKGPVTQRGGPQRIDVSQVVPGRALQAASKGTA